MDMVFFFFYDDYNGDVVDVAFYGLIQIIAENGAHGML